MPRHLSVLLAIALLLYGCTAPPHLIIPDGSSRIPINRSEVIAEYTRAVERDQAAERAQLQASQQQELFKRDIADLRAYMAAAAAQHAAPPAAVPPPANSVVLPPTIQPPQPPAKSTPRPAEIIRADDQAVLFRSFFANGDARFAPSPFFQQALLKAAMEGQSIAIWSATDARIKTSASESIARLRAEAARKFLIDKGVDPAKVKTNFLAAGGFVADNSAQEGRMKNRRVDIEIAKSVKPQPARQ